MSQNSNDNDRLDWIDNRLKMLDLSRKELARRAAFYRQSLNASQQTLAGAMQLFESEELALVIERNILNGQKVIRMEAERQAVLSKAEDE